jgi:diketogulonate reductase-like aldo/keto reductase
MTTLEHAIRTTQLPSGEDVPVLGQGTWHMAEDARRRKDEIAALRAGLDLGMTLIDTAEMYAEGEAEVLVGEAIERRRSEVFLVSKVLPDNATERGTVAACERSLSRLGTDYLDLYLLHWRGSVPLEATIEAFAVLIAGGKIRHWGVSNFDNADLEELWNVSGGRTVGTNQVLYNLSRRGIEWDVLPWCRAQHVPIMAYSPIEQGRILRNPEIQRIARSLDATPAQVALAWTIRQDGVIAIPKAGTVAHVRENRAATNLKLAPYDLAALDREFPPPTEARLLEML